MEVALVGAVMALILLLNPPQAEAPAASPPVKEAPVVAQPPSVVPGEELVVVLPDANGYTGTVVVERGGQQLVLNEPYATSRITKDGEIHKEKLPEQEVKTVFQPVVTALPARPMSFLLYFVRGSDQLTEASKPDLDRMLEELRNRVAPDILVIGHTDRLGKDDANEALSQSRAERVKAYLVQQGIAGVHIRALGRGEREPLVPTADGVEEPLNRRVEINLR